MECCNWRHIDNRARSINFSSIKKHTGVWYSLWRLFVSIRSVMVKGEPE